MRYYLDVIDELEKERGVGQWECGGIHIWPLVKFLLVREIFDYVKQKGLFPLSGLSLWERSRFAATIAGDALVAQQAFPADICLLTYNSFRQYRIGDKWFNIFQDPLIYFSGASLTALEILNTFPPRRPELNAPRPLTAAVIVARYGSAVRVRRQLRKDLTQVLSLIDSCCRSVLDLTQLTQVKNSVANAIPYVFALAVVFQRQLESIRPRLALLSSYYNMTGIAFCLACRRMGIPSADIAHGSSGKAHYAYTGWYESPSEGYELLPRDFLTRSEWDAEAPAELVAGSRFHRAPVVVGDLASHAWLDNAFGMADSPRLVLDSVRTRDTRLEVLVALQDLRDLPPPILEAMRQLSDRVFFWIRIHPVYVSESRNLSVPLDSRHFNVVEATSQPLYALLERVHAVLTESSSVAEDALPWNVLPIVTHDVGRFLFSDHIQRGHMIFAPTAGEIIAAVDGATPRVVGDRDPASRAQLGNLKSYLAGELASSQRARPA